MAWRDLQVGILQEFADFSADLQVRAMKTELFGGLHDTGYEKVGAATGMTLTYIPGGGSLPLPTAEEVEAIRRAAARRREDDRRAEAARDARRAAKAIRDKKWDAKDYHQKRKHDEYWMALARQKSADYRARVGHTEEYKARERARKAARKARLDQAQLEDQRERNRQSAARMRAAKKGVPHVA